MHLLATTSATLDDIVEPVDLGQPPGDIVVLSFADSDLAGLSAAWSMEGADLPSVRLAHLRDLRHPMSVDLWIERVGVHAKVIVVRLLGGLDWWRYGAERLAAVARERNIALALLPGEDRDDARLADASTLPAEELDILLGYFREGGRENLRALLRRLARHAGARIAVAEPRRLPRTAGYLPGEGAVDLDRLAANLAPGKPVVPVIFYRSMLLAADTAPIDALCEALAARGLAAAPLVIVSLKDAEAAAFIRDALKRLEAGGHRHHDRLRRRRWRGDAARRARRAGAASGDRDDEARGVAGQLRAGSAPADLAMHVVLPELDGRVLAGAIAFKDPLPAQDGACASPPSPTGRSRIASPCWRIAMAALVKLQNTPRSERRIAVLMPDYPGAPGRTGYAVGLDVPASVVGVAQRSFAGAVTTFQDVPKTSRGLLDALEGTRRDAALTIARL